MRNARPFFPLFAILFYATLMILPVTFSSCAFALHEKDAISLSDDNDIELKDDEFSDALHWSNTPVTRDLGSVTIYRQTQPVSGSGGTVDFLFSSDELWANTDVHYRAGRTCPPLVDLYIEETLYLFPMVGETISQYLYDKTITGDYRIDVYSVSSISAADFRAQLRGSHINGTTGAVLVGDLPEMIFEMDDSFGSYASFPCDLYFMDVDGEWADNDSNGKMDYQVNRPQPGNTQ